MWGIVRLSVWALGISAGLLLGGCSHSSGLSSGGSTFVEPMMMHWSQVYGKDKGVQINYTGGGSGKGISQMIDQTIDYGCTDAPMKPEQLEKAKAKNGDVIHIPLVMGGVVPAYNLKGIGKPINFDGPTLAGIFLGKITKWNDPALQKLNEGVELPATDIATVHRAEPSGTNYIFTDFLAKTSPEWQAQMGKGSTEVKWKTGAAESGNPGVAGFIARTEGAIGYIELLYALKNKIDYGAVRNQAGKNVLASLESVTAAAQNGLNEVGEDLTFNLNNMPGEQSYPICGAVWAVMYVKQPPGKGKLIHDFLMWATHDGQQYAAEEKYASLPKGLQDKIAAKLKLLTQ
jgi:phosphate transport system substrate-binding protein